MKIYTETSLKNFEFWSGAKQVASIITDDEMDMLEDIIEDSFPDGIADVQLNDLFWFDTDIIAEWLGYEDYEQMFEERSK